MVLKGDGFLYYTWVLVSAIDCCLFMSAKMQKAHSFVPFSDDNEKDAQFARWAAFWNDVKSLVPLAFPILLVVFLHIYLPMVITHVLFT